MEHQDRYLKVPEVAERLGLEEQTVRRWLRSGKLTGIELGSDAAGWRVPESEVQRVWEEVMRRDVTCRCRETVSVLIGTDVTCRCGRTHTLVRHESGLLHI